MLIRQMILSLVSTMAFAAFFSAPKKSIPVAGFLGMLNWSIFLIISDVLGHSKVSAAFIGTLVASILGELAAQNFKKPATVFVIPCLLPLVPGAGVYYTMFDFINKKATAASTAMETLLIAGAMAFGIIVSSVFSNSIKRKIY